MTCAAAKSAAPQVIRESVRRRNTIISVTEPRVALDEFKRQATAFCALLEEHHRFGRGPFLRQLAKQLAALYAAACDLPEVQPASESLLPASTTAQEQAALTKALSDKLHPYLVYWEVFDPFEGDNPQPVADQLADKLVEIHDDLRKVLGSWDSSVSFEGPNDVIWEARSAFVHHWSAHVTAVLKAVDALLNLHHVEALEPKRSDA